MKLFDFLLKEEEKEEKIIQTITQKITQNNYKIVECDGEKYIRFIESEIAKNGWSFSYSSSLRNTLKLSFFICINLHIVNISCSVILANS